MFNPARREDSILVDVVCIAFTPDNTQIISSHRGDSRIFVWDASSGAQIFAPLTGHDKEVNSVAVSPDGGRMVSGSNDMTVHLWDTSSGDEVSVMRGHTD